MAATMDSLHNTERIIIALLGEEGQVLGGSFCWRLEDRHINTNVHETFHVTESTYTEATERR